MLSRCRAEGRNRRKGPSYEHLSPTHRSCPLGRRQSVERTTARRCQSARGGRRPGTSPLGFRSLACGCRTGPGRHDRDSTPTLARYTGCTARGVPRRRRRIRRCRTDRPTASASEGARARRPLRRAWRAAAAGLTGALGAVGVPHRRFDATGSPVHSGRGPHARAIASTRPVARSRVTAPVRTAGARQAGCDRRGSDARKSPEPRGSARRRASRPASVGPARPAGRVPGREAPRTRHARPRRRPPSRRTLQDVGRFVPGSAACGRSRGAAWKPERVRVRALMGARVLAGPARA